MKYEDNDDNDDDDDGDVSDDDNDNEYDDEVDGDDDDDDDDDDGDFDDNDKDDCDDIMTTTMTNDGDVGDVDDDEENNDEDAILTITTTKMLTGKSLTVFKSSMQAETIYKLPCINFWNVFKSSISDSFIIYTESTRKDEAVMHPVARCIRHPRQLIGHSRTRPDLIRL